jgi:hypothetical protein
MVSISIDTAQINRKISDLARRQVPFAAAMMINDMLSAVKAAEPAALARELDRPTPFTTRGIFTTRASKNRLTGLVGFKDIQARYLELQAKGGTRRPMGRAIVVPVAQRLNKYGNMPRRALKTALAKPNVFSGKVNGVAGVWETRKRRGGGGGATARRSANSSGVKLLAIYKNAVTYRPRVKFGSRGRVLIGRGSGPAMARRLAQAVRSAR